MIRPIREDISEIFIIVKGGHDISKLENFVKWIPNNSDKSKSNSANNLPKIIVMDEVPYKLKNIARYLIVLHYSALDNRISSNASDFIKRYIDQGYLVCYIGEKRFGNVDVICSDEEASKVKEENIQTEFGITKQIARLMVDVSYEQGTLDSFKSLETYLRRILPTRLELGVEMSNKCHETLNN